MSESSHLQVSYLKLCIRCYTHVIPGSLVPGMYGTRMCCVIFVRSATYTKKKLTRDHVTPTRTSTIREPTVHQ